MRATGEARSRARHRKAQKRGAAFAHDQAVAFVTGLGSTYSRGTLGCERCAGGPTPLHEEPTMQTDAPSEFGPPPARPTAPCMTTARADSLRSVPLQRCPRAVFALASAS
eukprot:7387226-Prymnesium_polylepis.4